MNYIFDNDDNYTGLLWKHYTVYSDSDFAMFYVFSVPENRFIVALLTNAKASILINRLDQIRTQCRTISVT